MEGSWYLREQEESPEVYARVLEENTGRNIIPWKKTQTDAAGSWKIEIERIPAGGLYRIETCVRTGATTSMEWAVRGDMRHCFAKTLKKKTGYPIGLIQTALGGSPIAAGHPGKQEISMTICSGRSENSRRESVGFSGIRGVRIQVWKMQISMGIVSKKWSAGKERKRTAGTAIYHSTVKPLAEQSGISTGR